MKKWIKKILSLWSLLALVFTITIPIATHSVPKISAAKSGYTLGSCVVNDPQKTFDYLKKIEGVVIIICDTAKKVGLDSDVVNRIKDFASSADNPTILVQETGEFQISTPFPDFFIKDYKNAKTKETWQGVIKTLEYVKNNAGNNSLVRYWMLDSIDKVEKALLGPIPINVTTEKDLSITLEATDDLPACHDLKNLNADEEPDVQIKINNNNWSCTIRSGYDNGIFYIKPRRNSKAEGLIQAALNLSKERSLTNFTADLEVMLRRYQSTIPEERSNSVLKIIAPQMIIIENYANAYINKRKVPPIFIGVNNNKLSIDYEISLDDETTRRAQGNEIGLRLTFSDNNNHALVYNVLSPSNSLPNWGNFVIDLSSLPREILNLGPHKLTLELYTANTSLSKLEYGFNVATLKAVDPQRESCITKNGEKVCFMLTDKGTKNNKATSYSHSINYASSSYPSYSSNSGNWFTLDQTGNTYSSVLSSSTSGSSTTTSTTTTNTDSTLGTEGSEETYIYTSSDSYFVIQPIPNEITMDDLAAIDRNYPLFITGTDTHWDGIIIPQEIITDSEASKVENDDEVIALTAVQKIYQLIAQNPRDEYDKQYAINSDNAITQTINDYHANPPAGSDTGLSLLLDKNSIEPGMTVNATLTYKGTLPEADHSCHLYVTTKSLEEGGGSETEGEWNKLGSTSLGLCKSGMAQDWPTDKNLAKGTYLFKAKVLKDNNTLAAGPIKSSVTVSDNALPNSEGTLSLAANPNVGEIKQGEKITLEVGFDSTKVNSYLSKDNNPYSLKLFVSSNTIQSGETLNFLEKFNSTIFKDHDNFTVAWQTTDSTAVGTHMVQATVYENGYKINQTSLTIEVTDKSGGGGSGGGQTQGPNVKPITGNDLQGPYFDLSDFVNPFNPNTLAGRIVKFFSEAIGILAFAAMLVGGFWYITSGGDTAKVEKGKKTMLYAIAALAVYVVSFTIISIVINTLSGIF